MRIWQNRFFFLIVSLYAWVDVIWWKIPIIAHIYQFTYWVGGPVTDTVYSRQRGAKIAIPKGGRSSPTAYRKRRRRNFLWLFWIKFFFLNYIQPILHFYSQILLKCMYFIINIVCKQIQKWGSLNEKRMSMNPAAPSIFVPA